MSDIEELLREIFDDSKDAAEGKKIRKSNPLEDILKDVRKRDDRMKFQDTTQALEVLERYTRDIDDLKIGDYVVLSEFGKKTRKFPNESKNQVGKIIDRCTSADKDGVYQYLVAVALGPEEEHETPYTARTYAYMLQELKKYDFHVDKSVIN